MLMMLTDDFSALLELLTGTNTSITDRSPVSATFLIVCLKAQMMESRISLNWAGAMDRKAAKHWEVAAWRR